MTNKVRPLLCLAASGGGHVRQMLDLEPFWQDHASFFVTEDTALGRSIAADHDTEFVAHVALGQARLGHPVKMFMAGIRNCMTALGIIRRRRPDYVITTGAGSMFFVILWARLFGAKIVLIDSFARFDAPSVFARIGGPFAHVRIAQSEHSARKWGTPHVFDPFRFLSSERPVKEALTFATVGATLPFPRLVDLVEGAHRAGLLPGRVILQTGEGGRCPDGIECYETLPFDEVKSILHRADIVICHGGTGSLITALREGCRVISVPRLFELGEHYDNHQSEITGAFRDRGLLATASNADDFADALAVVRGREPAMATTDPAELIEFLRHYVSGRAGAGADMAVTG